MFEIFRKIWRTGTVTGRQPLNDVASAWRGKVVIHGEQCSGCRQCVQACPSRALAISLWEGRSILSIHHDQCICCGACSDICPNGALEMTNQVRPPAKNKRELIEVAAINLGGQLSAQQGGDGNAITRQ